MTNTSFQFCSFRKQEKSLSLNWWRKHLFSRKNESHPLSHQSLTQLTTVKLGFDQIRKMTSVSSGFRCTLLFLVLFVASQALAKPGNNANSTPVSSSATKHCNNVYNSFYAGPNKKIETILQEMKTQLTRVENEINILKGNKTSERGEYRPNDISRKSPPWGNMRSYFVTDFNSKTTPYWISHIRLNTLCLDCKIHHLQGKTKWLRPSFKKWRNNFIKCKITSPSSEQTPRC